jgi:predicted RNA-binding protein with RPS1 domain
VLEGIVSNVTSFGAFVDVGLPADAMVHISEISDRYVRDARELLSIGQIVRARIVDASGSRLGLSLKNVPLPPREDRPPRGPRRPRFQEGEARPEGAGREGGGQRGGDRGGRGGRGRDGGRGRGRDEQPANVRAAQTRRDGLGTRSSGFGRGGPRGGPGGGRAGGGKRDGGRGGDFGDREDFVRLTDVAPGAKPANKPFANFFKVKKDEGGS